MHSVGHLRTSDQLVAEVTNCTAYKKTHDSLNHVFIEIGTCDPMKHSIAKLHQIWYPKVFFKIT